jgi:hypothetical protein
MTKERIKEEEPLVLFGSRLVTAYPMTRAEYNEIRGWALPFDEDGDDAGYLINNITNAKPNTDFLDGYVSWLTEEQTTNEFRQTGNFPFGMAIEAMKLGHKVARSGWNGNGMYLVLFDPARDNLQTLSITCGERTMPLALQPFIVMKTVQNTYVPWLASQTDMLSDDWRLVHFLNEDEDGEEDESN